MSLTKPNIVVFVNNDIPYNETLCTSSRYHPKSSNIYNDKMYIQLNRSFIESHLQSTLLMELIERYANVPLVRPVTLNKRSFDDSSESDIIIKRTKLLKDFDNKENKENISVSTIIYDMNSDDVPDPTPNPYRRMDEDDLIVDKWSLRTREIDVDTITNNDCKSSLSLDESYHPNKSIIYFSDDKITIGVMLFLQELLGDTENFIPFVGEISKELNTYYCNNNEKMNCIIICSQYIGLTPYYLWLYSVEPDKSMDRFYTSPKHVPALDLFPITWMLSTDFIGYYTINAIKNKDKEIISCWLRYHKMYNTTELLHDFTTRVTGKHCGRLPWDSYIGISVETDVCLKLIINETVNIKNIFYFVKAYLNNPYIPLTAILYHILCQFKDEVVKDFIDLLHQLKMKKKLIINLYRTQWLIQGCIGNYDKQNIIKNVFSYISLLEDDIKIVDTKDTNSKSFPLNYITYSNFTRCYKSISITYDLITDHHSYSTNGLIFDYENSKTLMESIGLKFSSIDDCMLDHWIWQLLTNDICKEPISPTVQKHIDKIIHFLKCHPEHDFIKSIHDTYTPILVNALDGDFNTAILVLAYKNISSNIWTIIFEHSPFLAQKYANDYMFMLMVFLKVDTTIMYSLIPFIKDPFLLFYNMLNYIDKRNYLIIANFFDILHIQLSAYNSHWNNPTVETEMSFISNLLSLVNVGRLTDEARRYMFIKTKFNKTHEEMGILYKDVNPLVCAHIKRLFNI